MRVLHIQKVTGIGGSERHLAELLPALSARGVEVHFCIVAGGDYERFTSLLDAVGVDHTVVPAGPDLNPRLVPGLVREINRIRPDLVHTHLVHGDVYGQLAARIAGKPALSSFHATHSFFGRQPYRTMERFAQGSARRVIAISEHVARFLRELRLSRPEKVRVVRYGIDLSRWGHAAGDRSRVRQRYGLGDEEVVFGVASRLFHHKGHDFAIDAFAQASRSNPAMRLLIAGDGPLRASLEERARTKIDASRCDFVGFVPDIAELIEACDVMLFPTLPGFGEGFGLAALEAMAGSRCVVATDLDSLPEIVVHGETGYLVRPGDVPRLAGVLTELAGDAESRTRMGRAGRERAERHFTLDRMTAQTLDVYQEIA